MVVVVVALIIGVISHLLKGLRPKIWRTFITMLPRKTISPLKRAASQRPEVLTSNRKVNSHFQPIVLRFDETIFGGLELLPFRKQANNSHVVGREEREPLSCLAFKVRRVGLVVKVLPNIL